MRIFFARSITALTTMLLASAGHDAESSDREDLSAADMRRVVEVTQPTSDFSTPEPFETMQGGAGTLTASPDRDAFKQPATNLDADSSFNFELGKAIFEKFWVAAPSSTQASDGLGPLYNARSCHSCHLRNGRGTPPESDGPATSFILRLARNPQTEAERQEVSGGDALNYPDPIYGGQLQDLAVPGLTAEGRIAVRYSEFDVELADGETVPLRKPEYSVQSPTYGPLAEDTTLSPRIAQPMIGLGLIESIANSDILASADPDDTDQDGISGRAAMIREAADDQLVLGRFGWKAQHSTVKAQSAAALNMDIGISSPPWPDAYGDCTIEEAQCLDMQSGVQQRLGTTEAPDPVLDLLADYSTSLAVPARRDVGDPKVLNGKQQFYAAGCPACHTPKYVTRRDAARKAEAFQLIWPYSDFLLHDMGDGLADGQRVGEASGNEWRTAPLWGIGLNQLVNGHNVFLHDGRARTLEEAILWHGGEAEASKNHYTNMEKEDRQSLIRFLESL